MPITRCADRLLIVAFALAMLCANPFDQALAQSQQLYRAEADAIVEAIELPNIPDLSFAINDFGAVADDGVDDRPALLAAIAAASDAGGGRVVVPPGLWNTKGPLSLRSRINLHLEEGAHLLFSENPSDYLPVVKTRWEGTMMMGYSPLIYAADVEDVAITGKGKIDGNAKSAFLEWAEGGYTEGAPQSDDILRLRTMGNDGTPVEERVFGQGTHLRPSAVQFLGAKRVLLEDYTIINSPFWVNHLVYTDHATVRRLKVDSHNPNNDGIDIDSSTFVLVEESLFRTGDDSVVIKSGRDRDGREVGRPSQYVVVRNNDMGGEDGIALGSEMSGGISHVYFHDNILREGLSAIRFKSNLDRGGTVEHVRLWNFEVENFETLFWFQLDYPGEMGGVYPSTYQDIVFENFDVQQVDRVFDANAPSEAPLRDVTIRDVRIGAAKEPLSLKNVRGLTFDSLTIGDQTISGQLDWRSRD